MPDATQERFRGCLIGQCLGDALGFPVEGAPPATSRRYVAEELRAGRAGESARPGFAFGQYTDDSQLAGELLRTYVARGGFDPEDYAERVAELFRSDRIVGRGMACTQAALRLLRGVPWDQAGEPPPSAGNGTAMRAAPVGLMHHDEPERLLQVAHDQGRITHQDARCSAGSALIAGAVALAMQAPRVNTDAFVAQLAEWAERFHEEFAGYVRQLPHWVQRTPEEAVRLIAEAGVRPEFRSEQWAGISPFVIPSVLWSLYAFLRTPEDYWETVCTAIAVGGDVDTTGAMAGAISGAHLGLAAVPAALAEQLTDRGQWGTEQLLELADACYRLKRQGG